MPAWGGGVGVDGCGVSSSSPKLPTVSRGINRKPSRRTACTLIFPTRRTTASIGCMPRACERQERERPLSQNGLSQNGLYTDVSDQNIDNIYIYIYVPYVGPLKFGYVQSFKAIAVFQMVSHSVLACLISKLCCNRHDMSDSGGLQHVFVCLVFKLHCRRHDMSDAGELQHVLACLFCSLNCKR